jgi:hypothetical protein
MGMKNSYFALPNPLQVLERWLNPATYSAQVNLRGEPLQVSWSRRAERQLQSRVRPLLAEMQLYFSCVVKKRVLFHEHPPGEDLTTVTVNERLQVAFRAVEANSCDPLEFAANFPVRREFASSGASRMHPAKLRLDYKGGRWWGEFTV